MATKEQERAELHRTIWQIANELRGSVDGWDFKSYVLGMLFYRFISENLARFINDGERVVTSLIPTPMEADGITFAADAPVTLSAESHHLGVVST